PGAAPPRFVAGAATPFDEFSIGNIMAFTIKEGAAYPLGATPLEGGVNFALFSRHAERVELCLFDSSGRQEVARLALPGQTDHVWHGWVEGLEPGALYGYRVHGPFQPQNGHRFNPYKLLLDPYAKCVQGD